MTFDDLTAEWRARDRALEQVIARQSLLLRETLVDRHLEKVRRKREMGPFSLAIYIAFLLGFGLFVSANWGRWEFVVPGLALLIWTAVMGALSFAQHDRLRAVDFSAPVIEIQMRLTQLRAERARVFQWAFLTGQILWWIPFVIVLFQGLFGVSLYEVSDFMQRFITINLIVGVALIPVLLWIAHLAGPLLARSSMGRSVLDSFTGRDLAEARALAARLKTFEAEAA